MRQCLRLRSEGFLIGMEKPLLDDGAIYNIMYIPPQDGTHLFLVSKLKLIFMLAWKTKLEL